MRSSRSPALSADRRPVRAAVGWTEPGGPPLAAPITAPTFPVPSRVGLADVLAARDRLAVVAAGGAVLLLTRHLSARVGSPAQAADLLARLDQASMVLEYAAGARVMRCEVAPRWPRRLPGLLLDTAAAAAPIDRRALADALVGELSGRCAGTDAALRRLLSAVRFVLAFGQGRGREPLLLGGRPTPPTGRGGAGYDPSAHLLVLDGAAPPAAPAPANPLVVDVPPDTPVAGLLAGCDRLDPGRRPGRLVLRLRGDRAGRVDRTLDRVEPAVRQAGHRPVWLAAADPRQPATAPRTRDPRLTGIEVSAAAWPDDPPARHRQLVERLLPLLDEPAG